MDEVTSAADVLRKTKEMLRVASRGLEDLTGCDPAARPVGLYNVGVFGRSVTFVLQNLRTVAREAFDEWYAPHQKEMSDDPLLQYFKDLRNEILKKGPPSVGSELHIEYLNTHDLEPLMRNPPPGATSFFIGDQYGGSGWVVELPDGTTEKYYVQLPPQVRMSFSMHPPNPPSSHLGQPLDNPSIQTLCELYIAYLTKLVLEAEAHFVSS